MAFIGTTPDFALECARGRYPGVMTLNKFGENAALTSGTAEDLWTNGGTYVFPSSSGVSIEVVGATGDEDIPMYIQGLDADFNLQTLRAVLDDTNAATPVAVSGTWTSVFRAWIDGSTAIANGSVSIRNAADTPVYAVIPVEHQQTMMAIYTVPDNYDLYIAQVRLGPESAAAAGEVAFHLEVQEFGGVFRTKEHFVVNAPGGHETYPFPFYQKVPAKANVKLSATATAASQSASGSFNGVLIPRS